MPPAVIENRMQDNHSCDRRDKKSEVHDVLELLVGLPKLSAAGFYLPKRNECACEKQKQIWNWSRYRYPDRNVVPRYLRSADKFSKIQNIALPPELRHVCEGLRNVSDRVRP